MDALNDPAGLNAIGLIAVMLLTAASIAFHGPWRRKHRASWTWWRLVLRAAMTLVALGIYRYAFPFMLLITTGINKCVVSGPIIQFYICGICIALACFFLDARAHKSLLIAVIFISAVVLSTQYILLLAHVNNQCIGAYVDSPNSYEISKLNGAVWIGETQSDLSSTFDYKVAIIHSMERNGMQDKDGWARDLVLERDVNTIAALSLPLREAVTEPRWYSPLVRMYRVGKGQPLDLWHDSEADNYSDRIELRPR